MYFLTPLSFGLSLFLVGVLIFYLFRKQYDRQVVPSTLLWLQVMREWQATKWWRKLQRHLLLYLQLLILACLMFALARPYIGFNGLSGDHIVVVIDTSSSMTSQEGSETRLQLAKEEIYKLIDLADHQKMSIVLAEQSPTILLSKETNKATMRREVERLDPTFQSPNINEAVQLANQLLTNPSGEIYVFSDQVDVDQIRDNYLNHTVKVLNIGSTKTNLSLYTFGVVERDGAINGVVSVFNEMETKQVVTLKIENDGEELTRVEATIDPSKLTQVQISNLPQKPYYKASIVNEDDYGVDNTEIAFLAPDKQPSLYLVGQINPFVTKALTYLGTEMVQVENSDDIPQVDNAIYILNKVPTENWPDGPLLILSPETGGTFGFKNKTELKTTLEYSDNDSLMQFVDMEEVYIQKSYPFNSIDMQPVVTSGEIPVIAKGNQQGRPLILLGFDIEDSDWPLHSSFPIFLFNSISYLTEQQELIGNLQSTERKEITHSSGVTKSVIVNEEGQEVSELNLDDNYLEAPKFPGLYRVKENTNFGIKERMFAVALDEEEKSITPSKSFTLEMENSTSVEADKESPNEIWAWFTIAALLLLFVEWEVYRRGITS